MAVNPVPAAIVAPVQPIQQPVAAVVAAPVAVEPQIGNLNEREVSNLRSACRDRDEESGAVIGRILSVAAIIVGLFTAIVVPGVTGLVLGLAAYFIAGQLLGQTYHNLRNHDYLEAGQALNTRAFKEYIASQGVDPTIDTIVAFHQAFKRFALAQAQRLQVAAPPAPQPAVQPVAPPIAQPIAQPAV
jgi:hypothetical protein